LHKWRVGSPPHATTNIACLMPTRKIPAFPVMFVTKHPD
jgi:hypothetical protein